MLSKMKLATEVRQLAATTAKIEDEREEEEEEEEHEEEEDPSSASDSDSNNNNKSKDLNKSASPDQQQHQQADDGSQVNNCNDERNAKKTEDELLDIVEASKKRRISKDSADSLSSFIRWSFSNASSEEGRLRSSRCMKKSSSEGEEEKEERNREDADILLKENEDEDEEDEDVLEVAENLSPKGNLKFRQAEAQLVKRKKQASEEEEEEDTGSSAENLVLLKSGLSSLIAEQNRAQKRVRNHLYQQHHQNLESHRFNSIHATQLLGGSRKSHLLANSFVERNHNNNNNSNNNNQHQQHQQQQQVMRSLESPEEANALSYHLPQMLQQPNPNASLDDLCSQVNLNSADSSQLAVLAAALHKSLFDQSSANSKVVDSKSSVSTTSANSLTSNHNNNNHLSSLQQHQQHLLQQAANSLLGESGGNQQRMHLQLEAERQRLRQRMLQGSLPDSGGGGGAPGRLHQAASVGGRQQQHQRHAQAAAALSALASASSATMQHQLTSTRASQQPAPLNLNSFIHPALHHPSLPGGLHLGALAAAAAAGANHQQIVEFKCDTCPSSFDDRHRLMQHQSIHLELKPDWFTETSVDEVMKIFNRRRGEFLCNICNLRFEATLDYDQHNHSAHGPRPYCCQFCGNGTRSFRCWRQYLNHLYDHRYIFSCNIGDCDFSVNRKDSLRFHIFRFHLNCQLPQNQQQVQLPLSMPGARSGSRSLVGGAAASAADLNRWNSMDDCNPLPVDIDEDTGEGGDTDNEMNVAD